MLYNTYKAYEALFITALVFFLLILFKFTSVCRLTTTLQFSLLGIWIQKELRWIINIAFYFWKVIFFINTPKCRLYILSTYFLLSLKLIHVIGSTTIKNFCFVRYLLSNIAVLYNPRCSFTHHWKGYFKIQWPEI